MENSFLKVLDGVKMARISERGQRAAVVPWSTIESSIQGVAMGGQHGVHISVPTE